MNNEPAQIISYASDEPARWQERRHRGVFQWAGMSIAYCLQGLAVVGGTTALAGVAFGVYGPFGFAVVVLLLASIVAASAKNARRFRAFRILSYIQQALRAQLPLAPMMRAAALAERGALARRLEALQFQLYDGAHLAEALSAAVPELTDRPLKLIHAGESTHQLPKIIDQLIAEHQQYTSGKVYHAAIERVYLSFMLVGLAGSVVFISIFIMPKFQQIFRDFHVSFPLVTQWFFNWTQVVLLPLAVLGFLMLLHLLSSLMRESFSARLGGVSPVKGIIDWVYWHLPIFGKMERDQGLADVCQALSLSSEHGRPMDSAIAEAGALHINSVLTTRIHRWALGMSSGLSLSESAARAKLPDLIVQMLSHSQSAAGLAQTFDFLHRYYASRFSRTAILIRAIATPTITLIAGALVLFVMLSVFMPMLKLIDTVAATTPGGI